MLNDRSMSSFSLSIGTGIMFETIFKPTHEVYDPARPKQKMININEYKYHYINLYTLIRNILSAIDHRNKDLILKSINAKKTILAVVEEEIGIIKDLYRFYDTEPVFFGSNYKAFLRAHDNNKFNSDKIKLDLSVTLSVLDALLPDYKSSNDFKIITKNKSDKVLLTTHFACDLLNKDYNITLLESHTGVIKTKKDFNTKYKKFGKWDLTIFPFNEKLLHIFGDTGMLNSESISIKKRLCQVASDKKWNFMTSDSKIATDINTDKELKDLYLKIKRVYI